MQQTVCSVIQIARGYRDCTRFRRLVTRAIDMASSTGILVALRDVELQGARGGDVHGTLDV